jgi:hypothetical protein
MVQLTFQARPGSSKRSTHVRPASGHPGIEPRWTGSAKDAVGTGMPIFLVADRYLKRRDFEPVEIWKSNRQPRSVTAGITLRVQAPSAFNLRWTANEWQDAEETGSTATALGIEFVDIPIKKEPRAPIRFTFSWPEANQQEGQEVQIIVQEPIE